ncbi:MAG: hypothetical protein MR581_04115 [Lachnospiraceae bacterium]|nr:hypothetical protein [Lachnospiraceae bacterium]
MDDAIILFTYPGSVAARRDCFLCARRKGIGHRKPAGLQVKFSLRAQEGDQIGNNFDYCKWVFSARTGRGFVIGAVPEEATNFFVRAGVRSGTGDNGGRIDDSGY